MRADTREAIEAELAEMDDEVYEAMYFVRGACDENFFIPEKRITKAGRNCRKQKRKYQREEE